VNKRGMYLTHVFQLSRGISSCFKLLLRTVVFFRVGSLERGWYSSLRYSAERSRELEVLCLLASCQSSWPAMLNPWNPAGARGSGCLSGS